MKALAGTIAVVGTLILFGGTIVLLFAARPTAEMKCECFIVRYATPGKTQFDCQEILLKALAYSPKDRYPRTGLLLQDLLTIKFELTAKGPARWFLRARRFAVNGSASFFVALRYSAVLGLIICYLLILALTVFDNPAFVLCYLPFLLFHSVISWEGPETAAEAALRIEGRVMQ